MRLSTNLALLAFALPALTAPLPIDTDSMTPGTPNVHSPAPLSARYPLPDLTDATASPILNGRRVKRAPNFITKALGKAVGEGEKAATKEAPKVAEKATKEAPKVAEGAAKTSKVETVTGHVETAGKVLNTGADTVNAGNSLKDAVAPAQKRTDAHKDEKKPETRKPEEKKPEEKKPEETKPEEKKPNPAPAPAPAPQPKGVTQKVVAGAKSAGTTVQTHVTTENLQKVADGTGAASEAVNGVTGMVQGVKDMFSKSPATDAEAAA